MIGIRILGAADCGDPNDVGEFAVFSAFSFLHFDFALSLCRETDVC